MRGIENVVILSPIAEFHAYTPGTRLTDGMLRVLSDTIRYASDMLDAKGIRAVSVLDIAGFPKNANSFTVRTIMEQRGWYDSFMERIEDALGSADALALMPDVHSVSSPLCDAVRRLASRMGVPEADMYEAAQVDDSDFRNALFLIEDAVLHPRERTKIIMRGGRGR